MSSYGYRRGPPPKERSAMEEREDEPYKEWPRGSIGELASTYGPSRKHREEMVKLALKGENMKKLPQDVQRNIASFFVPKEGSLLPQDVKMRERGYEGPARLNTTTHNRGGKRKRSTRRRKTRRRR
jgi:hypothetical protein